MARGAVVEGLVRDRQGQPIPDTTVYALNVRSLGAIGASVDRNRRTFSTDGRGVFRIFGPDGAESRSFVSDRTAREVVTLNLFLALQESIALATHWLADEGWDVLGLTEKCLPRWLSAASSMWNWPVGSRPLQVCAT